MKLLKFFIIFIHFLVPKFFITKIIYWLSELNGGWITTFFIFIFVKIYKINMQEAKHSNLRHYSNFNKFFYRKLKKEFINIDHNLNVITSPVDGTILQYGSIKYNLLVQAKNKYYSLQNLLVHNEFVVNLFLDGYFFNIYLAPYNYHRVHMLYDAYLVKMIYVPGNLVSVNKMMSENINNLFVNNERLICIFKTKFGYISQILIGSTLVGGINTVWEGDITPPHNKLIKYWEYNNLKQNKNLFFFKGQEIGYFKFGSTVICLLDKNINMKFSNKIRKNKNIRVGQKLSTFSVSM